MLLAVRLACGLRRRITKIRVHCGTNTVHWFWTMNVDNKNTQKQQVPLKATAVATSTTEK
jgi:hypothetical protein